MGIINVTPDSFYEASRVQEQSVLRERVRQILDEGGAIIDVGAYSTRPGALDISAEAEMERLRWALPIVFDEAEKWHNEHNGNGLKPLISVDTFRAAVAERCVTELGADIINDISGGTLEHTPHLYSDAQPGHASGHAATYRLRLWSGGRGDPFLQGAGGEVD